MHGPFIFRLRDERPCRWFDDVEELKKQIEHAALWTGHDNMVILERLHITTEGQELWRQVETSQVLADTGR